MRMLRAKIIGIEISSRIFYHPTITGKYNKPSGGTTNISDAERNIKIDLILLIYELSFIIKELNINLQNKNRAISSDII